MIEKVLLLGALTAQGPTTDEVMRSIERTLKGVEQTFRMVREGKRVTENLDRQVEDNLKRADEINKRFGLPPLSTPTDKK